MKWILVTTNPLPFAPRSAHPNDGGWNIGDVFARLGAEEVIRAVDPDAEFAFVNMDSASSILTPQDFDRAVFAGRPMFWPGCETHPLWTELINGWLCADPRRVFALGVGHCYPLGFHYQPAVEELRAKLARRVAGITTREGPWEFCPSSWYFLGQRGEKSERSLANLMPDGGHYPEWAPEEAYQWKKNLPDLARSLRSAGFEFVAHTRAEYELARTLAWEPREIVYSFDLAPYLEAYRDVTRYVGNRVHGAIATASQGRFSAVYGLDSRMTAAAAVGSYAFTIPRGIPDEWKRVPQHMPHASIIRERIERAKANAINLLKTFAQ